mmetsp:Transcript_1705/g.1167  ORF Transcript_1705/g.1167 Transcript_1705/m.1167 type:complete len:189 (-) Transcript_1705:386-952(-)
MCGETTSLSQTVDDQTTNLQVENVLNFVNYSANVTDLYACYWHFYVDDYEWEEGSYINVKVRSQSNVQVYMFGGNSRRNASINLTVGNSSLTTTTYSIDASAEVMLMMVPVEQANSTEFKFSVYASGEQYSWLKALYIGEDADFYFYLTIIAGSLIVLILFIILIICICRCCKKSNKKKITPEEHRNT